MIFHESPVFPEGLAYGAHGGPGWMTHVVVTRGGQEQRNQAWKHPLRRYEFGHQLRDTADTQALQRYFRSVAQGQAHGFRFLDFLPGESSTAQSFIGTGTGVERDYQLLKRYQAGLYHYSRPITKPVAGTVRLFVDTVETMDFTVDMTTGVLTTTQDGDAVLTASCTFHVPVRFAMDHLDLKREGFDSWSWPSIVLQEVRMPVFEDAALETLDEPDEEPPNAAAPVLDQITTLVDTELSQGIPRLFWTPGPAGPSPLAAYRLLRRRADGDPTAPFRVVGTVGPAVVNWRDNTLASDNGLLIQLSEAGFEYAVEAYTEDGQTARSNSLSAAAPIPFVISNAGNFNSAILYGALDFGEVPIAALPHAVPDFGTLIAVVLAGTSLAGSNMVAMVAQFSSGGGTNIFSIRDTLHRLSDNVEWVITWEPG